MKIHGTITSIGEFNQLIENIRARRLHAIANGVPMRQEYYRGQLSSEWNVKPSIARGLTNAGQIITAEKEIIELFKAEMDSKGRMNIFTCMKNQINFKMTGYGLARHNIMGYPHGF